MKHASAKLHISATNYLVMTVERISKVQRTSIVITVIPGMYSIVILVSVSLRWTLRSKLDVGDSKQRGQS